MISIRTRSQMAAALAVVALATLSPVPAASGGPISDMLARHRQHRQMRIPPIDKPFSGKPVKDVSPSSLSGRFKKRFSLTRPDGSSLTSGGLFSPKADPGFTKTSR